MAKFTWCVRESDKITRFDTIEEAHKFLQDKGYKYTPESATWTRKDHGVAFVERMRVKETGGGQ